MSRLNNEAPSEKDIEEAFKAIDVDNSGTLDKAELTTFLKELGLEEKLINLLQFLLDDHNKEGSKKETIDINEFKKLFKLLEDLGKDKDNVIRMLYNKIDVDGSNSIEKDELKTFIKAFGGTIEDDDLDFLFQKMGNKTSLSYEDIKGIVDEK